MKNFSLIITTFLSFHLMAQTNGNICEDAYKICDTSSFTFSFDTLNSSAVQPNCFDFPVNQDFWIELNISSSGTMAWQVIPNSGTELDFAVYDFCPAIGDTSQPIICNYNHQGNSQVPIGLDSLACVTCSGSGCFCAEFSLPINVNQGETYYILIDQYSIGALDAEFVWTGTAGISCTTGYNIQDLESKPLLYPNPSNDYLYIDIEQGVKSIVVYNLLGIKVLNLNSRRRIDISMLAKGNYVVEINADDRVKRIPFVKN